MTLISIGVDLANGETLFEWKPLSSFPVIIEKNETKFFFFFATSSWENSNISTKGLIMCSKKKILALESRDLSQTDANIIMMSSFPKLTHLRNDFLLN